jgi:uncharacterized zinc-type alcohol dehydrogenase-like protein
MTEAKGYAALSAGAPLVPYSFHRRELAPFDIALSISFAGICHSDIHQARQEWGPALFPMVPGHEIAGVVTALGSEVKDISIGDHVGVGVFVDSCRNCKNCQGGLQQYCSNGMTGTYNSYERDGKTLAFGGYSNYFVVNRNYAVKIPKTLALPGVAPLLCAGITLYSPLRHWRASANTKVGIIGLGGLGHMGVKLASALGSDVTVFSHSANKREDALAMGADNFVYTGEPDWNLPHIKKFDLILNTVSADIDLEPYLSLLDTDGVLVVIGLPGKPYSINASTLLDGRRSIAGSMIGGMEELQEMIDFCAKHEILSDIEVISADYINQAYERTVASDVKYRFVIDASTF